MNPRSALPVWSSAAPPSDGFVVAKPFLLSLALQISTKPKGQIIGISLGGSTGLEASQNDVCYTLALITGRSVSSEWSCHLSEARLTVKTLPPTTAADSEGDKRLRGGMRTSMGFRQPWFNGMSADMRHRRQYMIAEYVTASGALTLPGVISNELIEVRNLLGIETHHRSLARSPRSQIPPHLGPHRLISSAVWASRRPCGQEHSGFGPQISG